MIKKILYFWPTAIVVAMILYATLSSDPIGADELPAIPHIDKLIHAIMMGGLLSAICFDYQRLKIAESDGKRKNAITPRLLCIVFAITVVASFGDELLQGAMDNGRGKEMADFAADCIGAIGAAFLAPPAIRRVLKIKR